MVKGGLVFGHGVGGAERRVCIPTRSVGMTIVLLVMVLLAGCGKPEIVPLQVQAAPWADGEVSLYQITDMENKPAGTATITFTTGATQLQEEAWTMQREVAAQGNQEIVVVEMTATDDAPFARCPETKTGRPPKSGAWPACPSHRTDWPQ